MQHCVSPTKLGGNFVLSFTKTGDSFKNLPYNVQTRNAIRKHNEYLKHGLGNDLIITFESGQKPLDLEAVEAQVKKYALAKSATN